MQNELSIRVRDINPLFLMCFEVRQCLHMGGKENNLVFHLRRQTRPI